MRVLLEEWSIEGLFARIQADTRPWLLQSVAQIVLVCDEVKCTALRFVVDNQIHQRMGGVFFLQLGVLGFFFTVDPLLQLGILNAENHPPPRPATIEVEVFPISMITR